MVAMVAGGPASGVGGSAPVPALVRGEYDTIGDRVGPDGIRLRAGSDLGPQLHSAHTGRISPRGFRPVRMTPDGESVRFFGQPMGGLWTSSLREGTTSLCHEWLRAWNPCWFHRKTVSWWRLDPAPSALVVVIDSAEAYYNLASHFPYTATGAEEPDYAKLRRAGIDAVHMVSAVATREEEGPFAKWKDESTIWLNWAFEGDARELPPPTWQADLPRPRPGRWAESRILPIRQGDHWREVEMWRGPRTRRGRVALDTMAEFERTGQISRRMATRMWREAPSGAESIGALVGQPYLDAFAMFLDDIVVGHTLIGDHGGPLPVGQDFTWVLLAQPGGPELIESVLFEYARSGESFLTGEYRRHWARAWLEGSFVWGPRLQFG